MAEPTRRKSGSSLKIIGDRTRREFLQCAVATAVLTSPALAGIAAAADVATRSRFVCIRRYDADEPPTHHFLTIVGEHRADLLKVDIDQLGYDLGQNATGYVRSSLWFSCPSHAGINAGLGLIALLDSSPISLEIAVTEASAWLKQGSWVYLAVSSRQEDLSIVFQAMSALEGNWQIVRCNDLNHAALTSSVLDRKAFVSNAINALLVPHENYNFPCFSADEWNAILNKRLINMSCHTGSTFEAIQAELCRAFESEFASRSLVAVVIGPIQFVSLKFRFRLQTQIREAVTLAYDYVLAAEAFDGRRDYSMYLLQSA